METLNTPHYKAAIQKGLKLAYEMVENLMETTDEAVIRFKPNPEKWSIVENLDHLILSSRGIASVLARPKEVFAPFGRLDRPAFNYKALFELYEKKVPGVIAPPNVQPKTADTSSAEILASWKMIKNKLVERLEAWSEEDMDTYCLMHPLLGRMSMREMLFFTIFHTEYHLKIMQRRITQA